MTRVCVFIFWRILSPSVHKLWYVFQNAGNLGPGQYEHKSFLDEMSNEHKKRQGKFTKVDQHPEKPSDRIHAFTLSQNPREKVDIWSIDKSLIFFIIFQQCVFILVLSEKYLSNASCLLIRCNLKYQTFSCCIIIESLKLISSNYEGLRKSIVYACLSVNKFCM